ncbi:hypothetical protein AK830_g9210 [Neonectria ditissima]|uniref:Small EDRK-rich factor-like N-terminal domain-containing protein n=1 Tax=Neonectria ditissima TaxID=78410 RepID=A0A0P7AS89_9HYPO|nr:hypothetical protein AK830_g9210 [Neonectria ditissima]
MGNGAKAQQKRDRAQKDNKPAKSQLKVNKQACDIQCQICKSTFLKTTKAPAFVPLHSLILIAGLTLRFLFGSLTEHAGNKHSKTLEECFPTFQQ